MVTPMKMELTPSSRQRIETTLRITNEDPNQTKIIDLVLIELSQWESGTWRIIEPGSDFDMSKLTSCIDWIKFGADSVEVKPMSMVPVTVRINVPPAVRGFYAAAILVKERPRPDVEGIALVVRFVVPVLVEIQGQPMRHNVTLNDIGMESSQETFDDPATTLVSMRIANNGGTYARLRAFTKVKKFSAGHWREITTAEFRPVSILPGVEFNLKSDIQRSLPPGKYRLSGALYVDGRRVKPIEKEIDFAGDPSVTKVAVDAALEMSPTDIVINAIPGATRTTVLKVYNASDETVNVRTALTLPPILRGVAFGEVKGDDLNCTGWVKVVPETFTIRGGGRQNIRIIAEIPNAELIHPSYYALLSLRARYPDGQNAGIRTTHICVANTNVEAEPAAQPMKLTLAANEEENKYVVVARFGNVGNVHFAPRCRATVSTTMGKTVARMWLAGKAGLMLPLELRDFSGVLDFSKVPAGAYRLTAILEYADLEGVTKQTTYMIPIRVTVVGEQRIVEIIG
jgi:hypothetical protein